MEVLMQGVQIAAVGMTVVFLSLAFIAWILSYFDRIDRLLTYQPQPVPTEAPLTTSGAPVIKEGEISPEIIAVISAAVAVALGEKVQIKHIRYRHQPADRMWAVQGRATIMASHAIKRRDS